MIISITLILDKLSYQSIYHVYKPRVLESSCSLLHVFITYILRVPFGPKFDFRTSWRPLAALIFTAKACEALATSAFGLSVLIADMIFLVFPLGYFPFGQKVAQSFLGSSYCVDVHICVLVINHLCCMLCPVGPWFGNKFYFILFHNSLISWLFFLIMGYLIVIYNDFSKNTEINGISRCVPSIGTSYTAVYVCTVSQYIVLSDKRWFQ